MIPPLGLDGHLPRGRYLCSLEDLRARFVDAPEFARSRTRRDLFVGLLRYITAWEHVESATGVPELLRGMWIGGSFASSTVDPDDLDVSPIIDGDLFDSLVGRPGAGAARRLFEQRKRVVKDFGIEPFAVLWRPVLSLDDTRVTTAQRDYLIARGRYDDLWQRVRSGQGKGPFTVEDCGDRRGYLEVTR